MAEYEGRKALIIGLARTGLSAANLLDRLGASTTVTDVRDEKSLESFANRLPRATRRVFGGHEGVSISDYDLAVISPGVPWDSEFASEVRRSGVELISEIELAASLLSAPIIAVTGSNGKSTTTALVGEMIKAGGKRVYVGGNIGAPLADAVGGEYDWVVAEVSSFQLEGVKAFRPRIGLILNITPDHMDRHKSMEAYAALKKRLYENQREGDTLILNAADPALEDISPAPGVRVLHFGPRREGRDGCWIENDKAVACVENERSELFRVGDLKIKGLCNVENAMAAALAAYVAGIEPGAIRDAVSSFKGLPHRMELVADAGGIAYIDDSKGTNVDATLKSLSGYKKNVALIAGGSSKGGSFEALAEGIRKHAKGVVLIGETAREIEKELGRFEPKARAEDMESAVRVARKWLSSGDTLLLSPACASFDMYENYEKRGEAFASAVRALLAEEGA